MLNATPWFGRFPLRRDRGGLESDGTDEAHRASNQMTGSVRAGRAGITTRS